MATIIEAATGRDVYPDVIKHVLATGRLRSPRGITTLDAGLTIIELQYAHNALPIGCGRDLNCNIAAAEAVQLIGGFSNPELLLKASPKFKQYMDDGVFHGAYGVRISKQMTNVVRKLREDHNTRQAIATLWDPWLDNISGKHDYPCTIALQFEIDPFGGMLNMTTIMRSNDAWLGLPYDMFQFTQLQMSAAIALGVAPGRYRHVAMSLHLYGDNIISAEQKIHASLSSRHHAQPAGIGRHIDDYFSSIALRARRLPTNVVNEEETVSEAWYRERFASYLGPDVDERSDGNRGEVAL